MALQEAHHVFLPAWSQPHTAVSLNFSGSKTKARVAEFSLYNGHWKNSGLISPNSLHPPLFGDFGFSEGTRTMVLCHWSAIQTSRCVSSIYPPLVSSGHVLPCEDSSSLGSAGEGGRPHGNRRSLPTCARAPVTCGFGTSPNHIPGQGLFGGNTTQRGPDLFL